MPSFATLYTRTYRANHPDYKEDTHKHKVRNHSYYVLHREAILAKQKARRDEKRG